MASPADRPPSSPSRPVALQITVPPAVGGSGDNATPLCNDPQHRHLSNAGAGAAGATAAGASGNRPPSPVHEPLTFEMWWGRLKFMLFGRKEPKDPGATGVAARKDFGWLILGGSILCFIAGWVNAFTLLAARATVTHVTGSTTKAGMALSEGNGSYLGYAFGIWACFVLGGAIAGIIIVKDTFAMGRGYGHAFLLISALLLWASVWVIHAPENEGYLFLCAMAMGIQNGVTTRYSGNVVRTTHMTGLSTDIGITIGHVLRCHPKPERWKLKMYIPMVICFFLGAAAGDAAFRKHGRASLLFPTFFLFALGWSYIWYLARTRQQPFHRVLLKRVSNEILTPHSPTAARKRRLPHMPHMPQMHIPFASHHQQAQAQAQAQAPLSSLHAHHGRRHSSVCDALGLHKQHSHGQMQHQQQQQQEQLQQAGSGSNDDDAAAPHQVVEIGPPPAKEEEEGEGPAGSSSSTAAVV